MVLAHEKKTRQDQELVLKLRKELEIFIDANEINAPIAERLEDLAKEEIQRCMSEVHEKGEELEKAKKVYLEIKAEYDNKVCLWRWLYIEYYAMPH
jgi:hypothetical protein